VQADIVFIHLKGSTIWKHWQTTKEDPIYPNTKLPGVLSMDPRVVNLEFVQTGKSLTANFVEGYFVANFTIVLKPLRPFKETFEGVSFTNQTQPPVSLSGMWTTRDGDFVQIEASGRNFIAIEYPHARSWGTVSGVLDGDTVLGVNFRSSTKILDDSTTVCETI